jgi:hypothetical protein
MHCCCTVPTVAVLLHCCIAVLLYCCIAGDGPRQTANHYASRVMPGLVTVTVCQQSLIAMYYPLCMHLACDQYIVLSNYRLYRFAVKVSTCNNLPSRNIFKNVQSVSCCTACPQVPAISNCCNRICCWPSSPL